MQDFPIPVTLDQEDNTFTIQEYERVSMATEDSSSVGKLRIGKNFFSWEGEGDQSFWVKASDLVLQAVCRDSSLYPKPCIYCQLNTNIGTEDDEEQTFQTLFLIPTEEELVEPIFEALCELVKRNPEELSDEEESEWYGTFDSDQPLLLQEDWGQFEDAEEN